MRRLSSRLTISLTVLILLVMIGLAVLLGQIIKTYASDSFEQTIEKESQVISFYIKEHGGLSKMTENKVRELNHLFQTNLVIVLETGEIILDEQGELATLSEQKKSDMIHAALSNENMHTLIKTPRAIPHMYQYSLPFIKSHLTEGYVLLYSNGEQLEKVNKRITWLLVISFSIAIFIIILYGSNIMWRMTRSIDYATEVISQLAKGNFRSRLNRFEKVDVNPLNKSVNLLANNLETIVKKQEMQSDRLSSLVENMGSGLILIDGHGFISVINRTYKEMFQIEGKAYENKPYSDVIPIKELTDMVEGIFMTEQKIRRQMILPIKMEHRHFEVYGAPIIGENSTWKGISLVFHDITELKKLEQTRKDFVANVSHEIKTPITSIKGFSETLLDGALEDEQALHSFLSIILKESNRLEALVQDLLELSKIEQEGFTLDRQKVNMYDLLEEVSTLLTKRAEEKGISLQFTCNSKKVFVYADHDRMKQVCINLINNAISYTHKNGTVTISLLAKENEAIIKISDTGIGIVASEIPRIFERFYRIDRARSRNSGGTGLGLAIVKHIVEAHNGKIIVDSVVGKGTTFTIRMPK